MLTIIHGDDTATSRKKLHEELTKSEANETVRLDGAKLQIQDLVLAFESNSLFSESKTIVIEHLLNGLVKKERQELALYVLAHHPDNTVILWEGKTLDKNILKKYGAGSKEISCAIPSQLFTFLDSLGLVPLDKLIQQFHQLLRHQEAELIYAMITRQWRTLIIARDMGRVGLTGMAPWQTDKILRQAGKFSLDQLISSYRNLLSIDMRIKTGQTPYNVAELLDIWMITN
jgi:DNA polymerase III delta subunit